ncbi:MAG: ABC transporter substrate-binding protein [Halothermotrichaceae bacterium]
MKFNKKSFLFITVLLIGMLSMSTVVAAQSSNTPRDETLILDLLTGRVGSPGDWNNYSGWMNPDKGFHQLILEPLWMADYVNGEIINVLAKEKPEYNNDLDKINIKLREGVYWSDGEKFTADDVIFTINLHKKTKGLSYHSQMQEIAKINKLGDYEVEIELKEPNARFHYNFLDRWGALRFVPEHIWKDVDDPVEYKFNPPVGTGPYELLDYDQAGYWFVYELREDWQRTVTGQVYGKPTPKYVKYMHYGDASAQAMAMGKNEIDMAKATAETFEVAQNMNDNARGYSNYWPYTPSVSTNVTGATFNTDKEPFNNREVRWALTLALDPMKIAQNAFGGGVTFTPGYIPLNDAYQDLYKELQPWLKEFTIEAGGKEYQPYNPDLPYEMKEWAENKGYKLPEFENEREVREYFGYGWWEYSPEIAEQLLEDNGFTRNEDGEWLLPDGSLWEFNYIAQTTSSHPTNKYAFAMVEQWKKFGINAEARPTEQFQSLTDTGEFDVSGEWPITEEFGVNHDLYRSFSNYQSSYTAPIGETTPGHASRWHNEKLDKVLDELKLADYDSEKTKELSLEAAKITITNNPGISFASYPSYSLYNETYWTNYPLAEDPYQVDSQSWPNFKFVLPFLEKAGN